MGGIRRTRRVRAFGRGGYGMHAKGDTRLKCIHMGIDQPIKTFYKAMGIDVSTISKWYSVLANGTPVNVIITFQQLMNTNSFKELMKLYDHFRLEGISLKIWDSSGPHWGQFQTYHTDNSTFVNTGDRNSPVTIKAPSIVNIDIDSIASVKTSQVQPMRSDRVLQNKSVWQYACRIPYSLEDVYNSYKFIVPISNAEPPGNGYNVPKNMIELIQFPNTAYRNTFFDKSIRCYMKAPFVITTPIYTKNTDKTINAIHRAAGFSDFTPGRFSYIKKDYIDFDDFDGKVKTDTPVYWMGPTFALKMPINTDKEEMENFDVMTQRLRIEMKVYVKFKKFTAVNVMESWDEPFFRTHNGTQVKAA